MVYSGFRSLSPAGLLINDVEIGSDRILITARCRATAGACPDCGRQSEQVHSRYERRLLDLPSHGRAVQMRIAVRRFRCAEPSCRRRISPSSSATRWPVDLLGAPLGWWRSSIISA
jgi:transposase